MYGNMQILLLLLTRILDVLKHMDHYEVDKAPWTVEELISVAEQVIATDPKLFAHPERESNKDLNVRLIRDYVVRGFIPRPIRVGREANFGLDHIVHLLAVRLLLRSQKWSLSAIKASLPASGTEDLLDGLLSPVRTLIEERYHEALRANAGQVHDLVGSLQKPELNAAQILIERFKSEQRLDQDPKCNQSQRQPFFRPQQNNLPPSLSQTPSSRKLHLELEPGFEVVIDIRRLRSITTREIEILGEALKRFLLSERAR